MAIRHGHPPADVLTARALNRALLARQHLVARASMPAEALIEHLVGLQAQNPLDPYVALWSRLDRFEPDELATLILERRAVRIGLLRTTLHLTTADDALALWPVIRPVLERAWSSSPFKRQLPGVDIEAVPSDGRALLEAEPRTTSTLSKRLAERWPGHDATALGYAARFLPVYDNLLLSHDDRRHILAEAALGRLTGREGSFLVDGFVRGMWRLDRARHGATLVVEPFEPLTDADAAELLVEAGHLLEFMVADSANRRVELVSVRERDLDDGRAGIGGAPRRARRSREVPGPEDRH